MEKREVRGQGKMGQDPDRRGKKLNDPASLKAIKKKGG